MFRILGETISVSLMMCFSSFSSCETLKLLLVRSRPDLTVRTLSFGVFSETFLPCLDSSWYCLEGYLFMYDLSRSCVDRFDYCRRCVLILLLMVMMVVVLCLGFGRIRRARCLIPGVTVADRRYFKIKSYLLD